MTEDQFDDSLKNKIRDHRSPVPDDMWERINKKKDKDRKGFLFFFSGFTVLILGICMGGYLLMNHTKQKPEEAIHAVSGQELKPVQSVPRLKKDKVRTEKNSMTDVQHRVPEKRRTYSSQSKKELNRGKRKFSSYNDKKVVSATAADGAQNSSTQRDSLAGENDDSVLNATGLVNKPLPVVKPVPDKKPADTAQKASVKKTQKDSAADKKWYLDIYASPDWPIDRSGFPSWGFKLSYTIGLRINRTFGEHFSGKIGIQYSQINFSNSDSLHYLIGRANHLKSWDIPFLAGYSFGDEKLKMTVTMGGIANLSTFSEDSLFTIFKTNTGLSLYLGFNVEKKINQKISVYLEPYYRYRLTSMTIDGPDYFNFIDVVGLSFGARYYFLKPKKSK